jgi:hypothetical protein
MESGAIRSSDLGAAEMMQGIEWWLSIVRSSRGAACNRCDARGAAGSVVSSCDGIGLSFRHEWIASEALGMNPFRPAHRFEQGPFWVAGRPKARFQISCGSEIAMDVFLRAIWRLDPRGRKLAWWVQPEMFAAHWGTWWLIKLRRVFVSGSSRLIFQE